MNKLKKNIIMIGAGGHSKVIFDIANITGINISHVVDIRDKLDSLFFNLQHITSDDYIKKNILPSKACLINALGFVPNHNKNLRSRVYNYYKKYNYNFIKMIHPNSIISNNVKIGEGVNIMAGSVIQTGSVIEENTIINTGVLIDHECTIEQNVHIAPGAVICGNVKIGKNTFIGAGANILPNTVLPENSIIKAGTIFK